MLESRRYQSQGAAELAVLAERGRHQVVAFIDDQQVPRQVRGPFRGMACRQELLAHVRLAQSGCPCTPRARGVAVRCRHQTARRPPRRRFGCGPWPTYRHSGRRRSRLRSCQMGIERGESVHYSDGPKSSLARMKLRTLFWSGEPSKRGTTPEAEPSSKRFSLMAGSLAVALRNPIQSTGTCTHASPSICSKWPSDETRSVPVSIAWAAIHMSLVGRGRPLALRAAAIRA